MKTLKLSDTQYKCLLQALVELNDWESGMSCNDIDSNDKFYTLSKKEQEFIQNEASCDDVMNCDASQYLIGIITGQEKKKN